MSQVAFTVYGNPVGKARPRVVNNGGIIMAYTPKKTADWEKSIAGQALKHRPGQLLDGPLYAELTVYLQKPKSVPKKRTLPDRKPDHDNLEKAVFDSLEGIIYTNDSRIVEKRFAKRYGDPPRIEIVIRELDYNDYREATDCG